MRPHPAGRHDSPVTMNDKREMLTDNEGKPTKVLTIHMLDNSSKSIVVDEATETVEVRAISG